MVKKLIIFPGYYVPHLGGLETHVDEFVKYLSNDEDYDITVFAPRIPSSSKIHEIRWNNVKVIRYPAFEIVQNYPLPKLWSHKFWKLYIKEYFNDYDIVMTRTRFFFNSFLGLTFAKKRLFPIKLVHVEHGSDFVRLNSKFKSFVAYAYDMTIGKLVFNFSDEIVVISKAVEKFVRKNFVPKRKLHLIYRGIDFDSYKGIKKDETILKKYKGKSKFVFVGRLFKWKGVENTIKAIKELSPEERSKIVFFIVGYGEDLTRLKKLAGKELNKTIIFLGKKSFKDSISIMKACDCYIHSAYPGGGLSNSLLQALYLKLWAIASPHEGANEVINSKNGYLLKDNDPDLISDSIKQFLKNKKKVNKFNVARFDWNKIIDQYRKIL